MDGRLLSLFLSPHLSDPFLQPTIPSVLICPLTRFIYVEQYFSVNKPWPTFSLENSLAAAAKSLQSCPTLCDPIDGSPLGSSVPGILQARILEWVAISFSNAWKWKVKVKSLSRVRLFATPWTAAYQAPLTDWRPSSQWCHPAISSSVIPFSSCPQSLPASESFPMSQLFAWGGQSTGVAALASFLPKNTQGWSL